MEVAAVVVEVRWVSLLLLHFSGQRTDLLTWPAVCVHVVSVCDGFLFVFQHSKVVVFCLLDY